MTLNHYLGSDRPLPTGSFGYVYTYQKYSDIPKSDDKHALHNIMDLSHLNDTLVQVFETDLDASGLDIGEVSSMPWRHELPISKPYVYGFNGSFTLSKEMKTQNPQGYACSLKSIRLLLSHMNEHLAAGESMEIYTCWDSDFPKTINPDLNWTLHLPDFEPEGPFNLVDKQFIRVTK
ncbi:hypothetical protein NST99_01440 [Paenibacillus sp. FSL L8-0470]|uniref:hypothetical protein n=1 Tax=unclassified Paenibacillus TaxID=185978 RepID=UPI0030FC90F7